MPSRPRPDKPEEVIFRLLERIDRLETMVYGRNSSVTNGRTRFIGNESLLVQGSQKVEGWLVVTGTERVTGLLEVLGRFVASGAIDLTGPTTISGDTSVTGATELTGTTTITGPTNVTGELTVEGDWALDGDGKITGNVELTGDIKTQDGGRVVVTGDAGDTTLTNSKMSFANGSEVASYSNGGAGIVSPGLILLSGGRGLGIQNLPERTSSASGLPVGVLGIDPLGLVYRVVSG